MEEILYLWFKFCNFITLYIIDSILKLIFLIPFVVEELIYVIRAYRKGELDNVNMEVWINCKSKVIKVLRKFENWFPLIEIE